MIPTRIPDFDSELVKLRQIAPSGFVLAFGISMRGPEFVHNEYESEWLQRYEQGSYYAVDPVFVWAISKTGSRRWSEIRLPDVRGVLREASSFGMSYGVVLACRSGSKRSFFSAARPDREFTDAEIAQLDAKFSTWVPLVMERARLTAGELEVLRGLRDGRGQREISAMLSISESTVKQRALSACKKLDAKTRAQAVAIAAVRNYFE